MSRKLLDLSGKIDNLSIELFETVAVVAKQNNIRFFVVGATARDMILMYGYNIDTIRATQDIDIGIQVSNWEQYALLKDAFFSTGKFQPTKEVQRLLFNKFLFVDIIPFGAIADQKGLLSWPPDYEIKMNALGFEESYEHSLKVRIKASPILEIRFASLVGLSLMKIIAWADNYPLRKKDAQDLALITGNYLEAGNQERLFNDHPDLFESDFDYDYSSARLLGRDIAEIASPKTIEKIISILEHETGEQSEFKLARDMMKSFVEIDEELNKNSRLIKALKTGILEKVKKKNIL